MDNKKVDNKAVANTEVTEVKGELIFEDKVIQKITALALDKVDGLLTIDGGFFSSFADKIVNNTQSTSGINVEVGKTQVAIDMKIEVEYGKDIQQMYVAIKKILTDEIKKMTGLQVIEVNVTVVDIQTIEDYKKSSKTLQDRVDQTTQDSQNFISTQTENVKKTFSKKDETRVN